MIDESLHVAKGKKWILLAKKCFKCFYHTSFLESLYSYQVVPVGLCIKKPPCLPIISEDFDKSWRNALRESELILMNALIEETLRWRNLCTIDVVGYSQRRGVVIS